MIKAVPGPVSQNICRLNRCFVHRWTRHRSEYRPYRTRLAKRNNQDTFISHDTKSVTITLNDESIRPVERLQERQRRAFYFGAALPSMKLAPTIPWNVKPVSRNNLIASPTSGSTLLGDVKSDVVRDGYTA